MLLESCQMALILGSVAAVAPALSNRFFSVSIRLIEIAAPGAGGCESVEIGGTPGPGESTDFGGVGLAGRCLGLLKRA